MCLQMLQINDEFDTYENFAQKLKEYIKKTRFIFVCKSSVVKDKDGDHKDYSSKIMRCSRAGDPQPSKGKGILYRP